MNIGLNASPILCAQAAEASPTSASPRATAQTTSRCDGRSVALAWSAAGLTPLRRSSASKGARAPAVAGRLASRWRLKPVKSPISDATPRRKTDLPLDEVNENEPFSIGRGRTRTVGTCRDDLPPLEHPEPGAVVGGHDPHGGRTAEAPEQQLHDDISVGREQRHHWTFWRDGLLLTHDSPRQAGARPAEHLRGREAPLATDTPGRKPAPEQPVDVLWVDPQQVRDLARRQQLPQLAHRHQG